LPKGMDFSKIGEEQITKSDQEQQVRHVGHTVNNTARLVTYTHVHLCVALL